MSKNTDLKSQELVELLNEVAKLQVFKKAEKRRAAEKILIEDSNFLNHIDEFVYQVLEDERQATEIETSTSRWTAHLHPEWTPQNLEALSPAGLDLLRDTPTLSPREVEHIVQTS